MTATEILITREIDALVFLAFGSIDAFDGFATANAVTEADDAAITAFYGPIDTAQALRIAAQDAAIARQPRPSEDDENAWDALYNSYDR